jgi:hypothetical protein
MRRSKTSAQARLPKASQLSPSLRKVIHQTRPEHIQAITHVLIYNAMPSRQDLKIAFGWKSILLYGAAAIQRLVRVLCNGCKDRHELAAQDLIADPRYRLLGFAAGETIYRPVGCESCGGTGYRGRAGIFELLELTDEVRPFVGAESDASVIDRAAIHAGMTTMLDDAIEKCRIGMTAASEVLRVTSAR